MLGDKLGGESGKVTSQRVLSGPKVETSFRANGTLLGVNTISRATYCSAIRPDGSVYGEGQRVVMGEGGQMASWVGQGVGTIKKGGAVSYRGAVYYQSASAGWSRLNNVAAVFEYEVDAEWNTQSQLWEWK